MSIAKKISLLVGFLLAALAAVILVSAIGFSDLIDTAVKTAEKLLFEQQKEKLSLLVDTMADTLGDAVKDNGTQAGGKASLSRILDPLRFETDRSGYFFVYDFHGNNVVHPLRHQFEGSNRLLVTDSNGRHYIRELLDNAKRGGGFVRYTFDKPDQGPVPKLAYAKPIPNTDYWLATGLYIDNIDRERDVVAATMRQVFRRLTWATLAAAVGLLVLVLPVTRRLVGSITTPLAATTKAAHAIAAGDYSVRLPESGGTENLVLAQAFNRMTAQVQASTEELEGQVAARTRELKDKVRELEAANTRIMESIQYARTIQQALLPTASSLSSHLPDYFVIWNPKDVIGGDLFWIEGERDSFLVAVMDCTGHGVPGALMTMLATTSLSRVVSEVGLRDPALVLEQLNTQIRQLLSLQDAATQSDDGLDIGVCLVEPASRRITFAGARISLLTFTAGGLRVVRGDRSSIGYKTSRENYRFHNSDLAIEPGMVLYMHTDGLPDQVGGTRNLPLGRNRLWEQLRQGQGLPMAEQKASILAFFRAYKGDNEQRDDVTLLGFRLG